MSLKTGKNFNFYCCFFVGNRVECFSPRVCTPVSNSDSSSSSGTCNSASVCWGSFIAECAYRPGIPGIHTICIACAYDPTSSSGKNTRLWSQSKYIPQSLRLCSTNAHSLSRPREASKAFRCRAIQVLILIVHRIFECLNPNWCDHAWSSTCLVF